MKLQWPLVVGLGALGLVRPFLNIIGLTGHAIPVTIGVSVVWLLVVVAFNVREPLLTLVGAGVVYGVLAIVLGATLGTATGQGSLMILNPFAIVSILITNAIWGGLVGLIAFGIQKARWKRSGK